MIGLFLFQSCRRHALKRKTSSAVSFKKNIAIPNKADHQSTLNDDITENFNNIEKEINYTVLAEGTEFEQDLNISNFGLAEYAQPNGHLNLETWEDEIIVQELEQELGNQYELIDTTLLIDQETNLQNDIVTQQAEENIDSYGNMEEGRVRKLIADPSSWKASKNKDLRMKGLEYKGYSLGKKYNCLKARKVIGIACNSSACQSITETQRQKMFDTFWGITDWSQRKVFVSSHVDVMDTKKVQTRNENSRRKSSYFFHLPVNNTRIPVCRNMFLQTLKIGYRSVQDWLKNSVCNMAPDDRYRSNVITKTRKSTEINFLCEFLDKFPKLPSHYQRANSSKLFVEGNFNSMQDFFDVYLKMCNENSKEPVSRTRFNSEIKHQNISIYQLRKDQCDICTQFKFGTINQNEYEDHQRKKLRARKEIQNDVQLAKAGSCILLTMDLQPVKICKQN